MVIQTVLKTIRKVPLWLMKGAADILSGEGISSVNHAAGHAYDAGDAGSAEETKWSPNLRRRLEEI